MTTKGARPAQSFGLGRRVALIAVFSILAPCGLAQPVGEHRMPDPQKTPGHATYHTATKVCAIKSTKDVRNVPDSVRKEIYESYGIARCQAQCSGAQGCEIDHLISLELGGANTTDNLWPQPYDGDWNAHDKDRLENKLHRMICVEKSIALKEA